MSTINISRDYSDTPVGRFLTDGPFSGERFRDEFLKPALATNANVKVDIDAVEGFGSSFLEEAFGGLVRKGYFTAVELRKKLEIVYKDQDYKLYHDLIWKHIEKAKVEAKG